MNFVLNETEFWPPDLVVLKTFVTAFLKLGRVCFKVKLFAVVCLKNARRVGNKYIATAKIAATPEGCKLI